MTMTPLAALVIGVIVITSCAPGRTNGQGVADPISALLLIAPTRPNSGLVGVYSPAMQGWGLVCNEGQGFAFAAAACYNYLNFPGTARLLSQPLPQTTSALPGLFTCQVSSDNGTILCSPLDGPCPSSLVLAVTCKGPGYIGCFGDLTLTGLLRRVLSGGPDTSSHLTVSICIASCKERGYFYAGLEGAHDCFCGHMTDDYDSQGERANSECSSVCSGDSADTCGGSFRIAIYEVGLGVCEDPGHPANGTRLGDSFRYGDIVLFTCARGFVLEGARSLQCLQAFPPADPTASARGRRSEDRHAVLWNGILPRCTPAAEVSLTPSTLDFSTSSETTSQYYPPDGQTLISNRRGDLGLGMVILLLVIYNAAVTVLYVRLRRPCSDGKKQPADANVKPEGEVYTDLDIQLHSTSPQTQPNGRPLYQGLIATVAAPSTNIQSSASASITDDSCYINQHLIDQRAARRGAMKESKAANTCDM